MLKVRCVLNDKLTLRYCLLMMQLQVRFDHSITLKSSESTHEAERSIT